jgi:lipopolysaccharide export system protein LptC
VQQILVHEAIERKEMQDDPNRYYFKETSKTRRDKTGEEGAHVDANRVEQQLRDGKLTFKEAINKYYKEKK